MTHFNVALITEHPDEDPTPYFAPYDENPDDDEFLEFVDVTQEVLEDWENDTVPHVEYGDGSRKKLWSLPYHEQEKIKEGAEKGRTIFPKFDDGTPFFWDYQVKGFFKDSCGALRRASGTESAKCKAYKKIIDGTMFVEERRIGIDMHGGEVGLCERPLRAQTAQGERVSLASSETVPAGSTVEFTVMCLNDADMKLVEEWLDYGRLRGMGQWRNSGKGRFVWEKVDEG